MARYTSILLPLAYSSKKRLEEAALARGETLESFILEAAETEAHRIGDWLLRRGHSVDHEIFTSTARESIPLENRKSKDDRQVETNRVALELGWGDGHLEEWSSEVDRLIDDLESLDDEVVVPSLGAPSSHDARRSQRRMVRNVRVLNPVRGVVVDMSGTGLGIETQGPFSVPEEIHLSIGNAPSCAKVRMEVRWCELTRTERFGNGDVVPIYRSGLQFLGN